MIALRGNLTIALSGWGLLVIRDVAGDATVEVAGRGFKKELSNGATVYLGFDGKARISGSDIKVSLKGNNIEPEATGTGKFMLRGHGCYQTDKGGGAWQPEGTVVTLP